MMSGEPVRTDMLQRSKDLALRVIHLYSSLPKTVEAQVLGKQVLRSATSTGAHLREGKRSRSTAEMISKTELAIQELDESLYWLELLGESGIVKVEKLAGLITEMDELIAILVSSVKRMKGLR